MDQASSAKNAGILWSIRSSDVDVLQILFLIMVQLQVGCTRARTANARDGTKQTRRITSTVSFLVASFTLAAI
jgi:hypothetical protein